MKQMYFLTTIASFLLMLCIGCNLDPYREYYPGGQDNTRWTCVELDIYFDVSEKFKSTLRCNTYGQINLNGEITGIKVSFDYGSGVEFSITPANRAVIQEDGSTKILNDSEAWLFLGYCKFRKDKCVITVRNNEKGFLDDSIKTLTFIKSDIPEDEEPETESVAADSHILRAVK